MVGCKFFVTVLIDKQLPLSTQITFPDLGSGDEEK
jgi:hypothetical protein